MDIVGYQGTEIDEVRILALQPGYGCDIPEGVETITTGSSTRRQILTQGSCNDIQAASVIKLWNELPHDESMRCNTPGFAIQFILNGEAVFTAALCWHCNNISFGGRLASLDARLFNGESEAGSRLLQLCSEITGYEHGK